MDGDKVKLYKLIRHKDVTGKSGTGVVAFIAVFPSGRAVLEWIASNHVTITIFNNLEEITLIHGHGGASEVVPCEPAVNKVKCVNGTKKRKKK